MVCKNCGKEFEPKRRGRKNKGFCCKKCADQWRYRNSKKPKPITKVCEHCGKSYQTDREGRRYCSEECSRAARKTGRTVYEKVCEHCGKPFSTTDKKRRFCSPACASRLAGKLRQKRYFCEYCGKPRHSDHPNRNRFCSKECAIKHQHMLTLVREAEKAMARELLLTRECPGCGQVFRAKSPRQKYCSPECRYVSELLRVHNERMAGFIPTIQACPCCGSPFATTLQSKGKKYCSERCQKKITGAEHKKNRKEQMQRAFVEPVGLKTTYRAYNGICGICGLPVPETSEPSNIWAATVDHIVPLSKGGLHEKGNCQLAHRLCNSIKLDSVERFHIDWPKKLLEEPGRWNEQLDNLWEQLDKTGSESIDPGAIISL